MGKKKRLERSNEQNEVIILQPNVSQQLAVRSVKIELFLENMNPSAKTERNLITSVLTNVNIYRFIMLALADTMSPSECLFVRTVCPSVGLQESRGLT